MLKRTRPVALTLASSVLIMGCFTIGPDHEPPAADVNASWTEPIDLTGQGVTEPQADWWRALGDPVLEGLVEEAFAQNLTLEAAALRVLKARVGRRVSYQLLAPLPLTGGSVTHVNLSENVDPDVDVDSDKSEPRKITIGGGPLHPEGKTITIDPDISVPSVSVSDEIDIYDVGLDAIWELDIWGKKRRGICAADAELEAALFSYCDLWVSLAGEVAAAYVELRTVEDRKRHLQRDIELQRRNMQIAEDRLAQGAGSELDVLQLLSLVRETEAEIPPLDASIRQARNTLCFLLGKPPGRLDDRLAVTASIPTPPADIARGIPADLLRRRADVRRAERLAAAECERIGMAKTDLYPSFSLIGSIGWASSHSDDLFDDDSVRGAYGGGVHWNILLYTIIMDAVRVRDVNYQEAIFGYQDTVLRAAKEVEDDSVAYATDHAQLASLTDALVAQERSVELCSQLYERGATDLVRVLDAQRTLTRIQDNASRVRGSIALRAISLYKALGGGWEGIDQERILDDSTWKALESRTDWDWYKPDAPAAAEPPAEGGG